MTEQHPITPPPELVSDWAHMLAMDTDTYVFTQAARWGADQELEACCEWIGSEGLAGYTSRELRAARRPKPTSLKLRIAEAIVKGDKPVALSLLDEALPDD